MNEEKTRQSYKGAAPSATPPPGMTAQVTTAGDPITDAATARSTQDLLQMLARMLTERHLPTLGREAVAAIARYRAIRGALAHDQREGDHVQILR